MNPKCQSVNRVDVLKEVVPYWLLVLVNAVDILRQFRGRYLPQLVRAQDSPEEVHVASWTSCVSV